MGVTRWNIDLDRYINPYIFSSPASRLPPLLGRFLGCRHNKPRPLGNVAVAFWSFIGTVASLSLIYVVDRQIPALEDHHAPLVLGSFGAAAVLEFCAIDSPFAQPRNVFLGQLIGSIIGVAISKGLAHSGTPSQSQDLQWIAGALSCGCTIVAMGITGTVHPPAGATALLAVTDNSVNQLGWMLVPVVLLNCALMLVVALIINNMQRSFPLYWWTSEEVGAFWARGRGDSGDCEEAKVEAGSEAGQSLSVEGDFRGSQYSANFPLVTVTNNGVIMAGPGVHLSSEESLWLESLYRRL